MQVGTNKQCRLACHSLACSNPAMEGRFNVCYRLMCEDSDLDIEINIRVYLGHQHRTGLPLCVWLVVVVVVTNPSGLTKGYPILFTSMGQTHLGASSLLSISYLN